MMVAATSALRFLFAIDTVNKEAAAAEATAEGARAEKRKVTLRGTHDHVPFAALGQNK